MLPEQSLSLGCPYKGLIPYGEEDAPFFFGREKWCTIILNNLLASHLTLLYGTSGVGKSSVLQAGVASRLKRQARDKVQRGEPPDWAVIVCRDWRDTPLTTLRARILAEVEALMGRPLAEEREQTGDLRTLLKACGKAIARSETGATATAEMEPAGGVEAAPPGRLLLILDQFEEYFLYHPQEAGTGTFAEEFPQALNDRELSLNVLISLRDDSLAKLDRFKKQIPDLFANRLQIDHLDRAAAIDAIRRPIEEFNRQLPADSLKASVEPQLIQSVLEQVKVGQITAESGEDLIDQPSVPEPEADETLRVETPFLQLVMTRLWEEESSLRSPPRLRQETLDRLGGAGPIVREHLQRLMIGLPESSKRVAAIIFDKLVTSGLTKIAYPVFELTDPEKVERQEDVLNRQELKELLDHLSGGNQRILRRLPPALEQPKAEERYEIFHDVLAKPILEWRRAYRESAERDAERQRHAEELERERQSRRKLRERNTKIIGFLGLIIIAQLLWILRLWAQEQKLKGIEAAQQFKAQQLDQIDALVQALAAANSLTWLGLVDRRDVASNLRHILDNINEISKAYLLSKKDESARVIKFRPDNKAVGILFQNNHLELRDLQGKAMRHFPPASSPSGRGGVAGENVIGFAFDQQNRQLATVSSRGVLQVWNAEGTMTHRTRKADLAHLAPFLLRTRLHFSPDGHRLAFIDNQDTLRLLDLNASASVVDPPRFGLASGTANIPVIVVRFSPNGKVLAAATKEGQVLFLEATSGRRLPAPTSPDPSGPIFSMEFDPTGQALAMASPEGVRLWRQDPQGQWTPSVLRAGRTSQVRFSPDGRLLATASLDGRARLWAFDQTRKPQAVASFLNQAPVQDVRFKVAAKSNKLSLLTLSTAGTLHEWKLPPPLAPMGPARRVSAMAFSTGGDWLANAILGDRFVCLLPLRTEAGRASAEAPAAPGRCPGTQLPLPPSTEAASRLSGTAMAQLAFDPASTLVAGLSWRGEGMVWHQSGQSIVRLKMTENGPFSAISFSPDGDRFVYVARGGEESKLMLCPIQRKQAELGCHPLALDWRPVRTTQATPSLTSVRFLPRTARAGRNLLISGADGQVCFGSLDAGGSLVETVRCQRVIEQAGNVWQLSVSPDGSTIGLGGFDGTLHLFRRGPGDHLKRLGAPLKVSAGPLMDVSFSPRGGNLAAVSLDGTASLWDLQGRRLASFPGEEERGGGYMKAAFSADGRQLLLATTQGLLKVRVVEDLPMLLARGCKALDTYLANPATDESVRKRLSFCKR